MLQIQCPKCMQALQVPESALGKVIRCPKCQQTMSLGSAPQAAPPAPPPPPSTPPVIKTPEKPQPPPAPRQGAAPSPSIQKQPPTPPFAAHEAPSSPFADEPSPFTMQDEGEPASDDGGLGARIKVYAPRPWWLGLCICAGVFVINVPCTVAAFWIDDKSKPLIGAAMIPNGLWFLGIILFGTFAGFAMKRQVELRRNGLINLRPFGKDEIRWPEVTGVFLDKGGIFQATDVILELKDRASVTLPSIIHKIEELADKIIEATTPTIRPAIERTLEEGKPVNFGQHITITPKGLEFRPNGEKGDTLKLRWKEIKGFSLGRFVTNPGGAGLAQAASIQAQFRVTSEDQPPWICPTALVANFAIFIDIIEKRYGVKIDRG